MGDDILSELVHGQGAHVDPLACLEDISVSTAVQSVSGYPHSIWQIVEHMNYWMQYEFDKIGGKNTPYPEHAIESWPTHPAAPDDEQWHVVVKRFTLQLERVAALSQSTQTELDRVVHHGGAGNVPRVATVQKILSQLVAHNSYHVGQIALIRRMLGKWPPQRGGDSW